MTFRLWRCFSFKHFQFVAPFLVYIDCTFSNFLYFSKITHKYKHKTDVLNLFPLCPLPRRGSISGPTSAVPSSKLFVPTITAFAAQNQK